jgi:ankyrin repeat protein
LHLAARNGHDTTVCLLLDRGANIMAQDVHKSTASDLAAKNRHDTTVRLLLDRCVKESKNSKVCKVM